MTEDNNRSAWVRAAMTRYEGPLIRYAQRFTRDLETARDVVQDTFLKLCAADPKQVADHLAPWLYRVCRNRALDVRKKEARMQPLSDERAATEAGPDPGPAAHAAGRETAALLRAAIDGLPDKQQEVFRLKFQDQMTYKEISAVTGFPLNNVRYLIHTALKQLRTDLRSTPDLAGEA
jgi:RNA polymerase sigma-70 factor (ECF subfamily)